MSDRKKRAVYDRKGEQGLRRWSDWDSDWELLRQNAIDEMRENRDEYLAAYRGKSCC